MVWACTRHKGVDRGGHEGDVGHLGVPILAQTVAADAEVEVVLAQLLLGLGRRGLVELHFVGGRRARHAPRCIERYRRACADQVGRFVGLLTSAANASQRVDDRLAEGDVQRCVV